MLQSGYLENTDKNKENREERKKLSVRSRNILLHITLESFGMTYTYLSVTVAITLMRKPISYSLLRRGHHFNEKTKSEILGKKLDATSQQKFN